MELPWESSQNIQKVLVIRFHSKSHCEPGGGRNMLISRLRHSSPTRWCGAWPMPRTYLGHPGTRNKGIYVSGDDYHRRYPSALHCHPSLH